MAKVRILISIVILFLITQFLFGCAVGRGILEGGAAYMENPSMELVLDRLNTAGAAAHLASTAFNNTTIGAESTWPKELESFSEKAIKPIMVALGSDGAYAAHGGLISPIKAHVVQAQQILYDLPPDMYSGAGTCYRKGEPTIINGFYYKVYSQDKVESKNATINEIKSAIVASSKNIFDLSYQCPENSSQVRRRKGIIAEKGGEYDNIWNALHRILPNGEKIKDEVKKYEDTKKALLCLSNEIALLEGDKTRLKNNEKPISKKYENLTKIDEDLNIMKTEAEELKNKLKESKNSLNTVFEEISEFKGRITDEKELKTLANIVDVCKAAEGLLADATTLTVVALAKLPTSLTNLPNELKQLVNPKKGVQNIYIPLRLARLRFNMGNVADNIKIIAIVLKNDLMLIAKIHKEVHGLINIKTASK